MSTDVSAIPGPPRPAYSNPLLRFVAHILSYVFHPIFISTYVMGFLIFFHPYAFSGFDHRSKVFRLLNIVLCNAAFPLFSVFLLWRLKFISSFKLENIKERIVPYLIAMIFYWWTWNVNKHLQDTPDIAINFLLGSFLAICGGWFCNIYYKVSMHAIAMGGALMFFFLFSFADVDASGAYLAFVMLLTGLVCTARLLLGAHTPFEIWSGLFVGMLAQYVGWQF